MASLDSTERAKVALAAGESLIVTTTGQCTVQGLSGAPSSTTTLTASSQTFGPYGVAAVLLVTNVSGRTDYVADNATFPLNRAEKASFNALVSGAGNTGNQIIDSLVDAANRRSYTFAEALALAPSNAGKWFWIPTVGDGGSWWFADSSGYLRPAGGKCHLVSRFGSVGSPLLTYTGFTAYVFALPVTPVIPAGMLIPGQSHIWFHAWFKRTGANGTAVLKLHLGLNNNVASDAPVGQLTSAAIDNLDDTIMPMVTVPPLTTRLSTTWTKQLYGTTGGAVGADVNTAINTAVPMYGNISIAAANVADTFKLIGYRLSVEQ